MLIVGPMCAMDGRMEEIQVLKGFDDIVSIFRRVEVESTIMTIESDEELPAIRI